MWLCMCVCVCICEPLSSSQQGTILICVCMYHAHVCLYVPYSCAFVCTHSCVPLCTILMRVCMYHTHVDLYVRFSCVFVCYVSLCYILMCVCMYHTHSCLYVRHSCVFVCILCGCIQVQVFSQQVPTFMSVCLYIRICMYNYFLNDIHACMNVRRVMYACASIFSTSIRAWMLVRMFVPSLHSQQSV
jgi:hypothetical protein